MVVGAAHDVFINMGKLEFNPGRAEIMVMENGTESMPKTMSCSECMPANLLKKLVDATATTRLIISVYTRNNQLGVTGSSDKL